MSMNGIAGSISGPPKPLGPPAGAAFPGNTGQIPTLFIEERAILAMVRVCTQYSFWFWYNYFVLIRVSGAITSRVLIASISSTGNTAAIVDCGD